MHWEILGPFGEPNPNVANLALAILLVLVIFTQAGFSIYQDYSSSKIMGSIQSMLPKTATVMRDGKERSIPVSEIVKGDLVKLKYGSKIPADLRFVEVHGIKMDNSILTGEALPIQATVESTDENITDSRNIGLLGTGFPFRAP